MDNNNNKDNLIDPSINRDQSICQYGISCYNLNCKLFHPLGRTVDIRYKTALCKLFINGSCTRGDKCSFAHSIEELKIKPKYNKDNDNVSTISGPVMSITDISVNPKRDAQSSSSKLNINPIKPINHNNNSDTDNESINGWADTINTKNYENIIQNSTVNSINPIRESSNTHKSLSSASINLKQDGLSSLSLDDHIDYFNLFLYELKQLSDTCINNRNKLNKIPSIFCKKETKYFKLLNEILKEELKK